MDITVTNANALWAIKDDPSFVNAELYQTESSGHKFAVGERRTLTGLVDFAKYNGDIVEITAIREDGHYGKAYYIKGRINEMVNWVYEYRLA